MTINKQSVKNSYIYDVILLTLEIMVVDITTNILEKKNRK